MYYSGSFLGKETMMGRPFLDVLLCLLLIFVQCQHIIAAPTTSLVTERDNLFTINTSGLKRTGWHWVDTWTAMPQLTEPANLPNPPFVRFDIHKEDCRWLDANDDGMTRMRLKQSSSIPPSDRRSMSRLGRRSSDCACPMHLASPTSL